jgi:hypothetical protein
MHNLYISLICIEQFCFLVDISQDIIKKLWFYHIRKPINIFQSIQFVLIQKILFFCYWHRVLASFSGLPYSNYCFFVLKIACQLISDTDNSHSAAKTCLPLIVVSTLCYTIYYVHLRLLIYFKNICDLAKIRFNLLDFIIIL